MVASANGASQAPYIMPGHVTATYGHSVQFLAKLQGKLSLRIARAIRENIVKNSKKRRLTWPCVSETCATFPFPSCLHMDAGFLRRAASWIAKIRENTEVRRAASFEPAEYPRPLIKSISAGLLNLIQSNMEDFSQLGSIR